MHANRVGVTEATRSCAGRCVRASTIALSSAIFDALAPGELDPEAFAVGSAATEADDRIIYDPTSGNLFYDADGSGVGGAVLFATFGGAPDLHATDFAVI